MWAVQFHPEVHHTKLGTEILRNFALNLCGAKPDWTAQHFIDATIQNVRQTVGKGTRHLRPLRRRGFFRRRNPGRSRSPRW